MADSREKTAMRLRSILLVAFCALPALPTPVSADEVEDVLVLPDGAIFIALDRAPDGAVIDSDGAVRLSGWTAPRRVIAPYGAAGFTRLVVDGGVLRFDGARPEVAELRDGGVLLRLNNAGAANFAGAQADTSAPEAAAQASAVATAEPAAGVSDRMHSGDESATHASSSARSGLERTPREPEHPVSVSPAASASSEEAPVSGPCDAQAAALADAPWDLDLIVAQADCLVEAGERENAVGLYERVLAFEPEHFRAALGLARLREHAGRHEDAARLFEAAAGSALTDGEALAARAAARRARERSER